MRRPEHRRFRDKGRAAHADRPHDPPWPGRARGAGAPGRAGSGGPAGSFHAYEAFAALKIDDPALRVGLAPYNDEEDVDRLLDGLATFL
ncbi:hypothetical protein QFZ66_002145 [Streptomyces sp. B4I13]|uniref:hypothetical protein n=1 Tax=Streptomyces sp. B4I13 TaxID=3042271 RepID=UPI002787A6A0|nr:hypothetical protein [Streptomyces sp. B4I13]MDQ0958267.1 hypothetical protein [Streptomyces sp. B4I13]